MIQSWRRGLSILASNASSDVTSIVGIEDIELQAGIRAALLLPHPLWAPAIYLLLLLLLGKHCAAGTAAAAGYSI